MLLSSVTAVGAIRLEINSSTFSKWATSVGELFTSSSSSSSTTSSQDVVGPFFTKVGGGIKSAITDHVWPLIKSTFTAFTSLGSTYNDWFGSTKNFLSSTFKTDMLRMFLENIHMKLWKTLSFFVSGERKSQFIGLFKQDKWANTLMASKFLLGLPLGKSSNVKARPEVFNFLLMKWMENPDKVTTKVEGLIDTIKELNDSYNSSSSSSSSGSSSGNEDKVYWLEVPTLNEYLNVDLKLRERLWKYALMTEIYTQTQTGHGKLVGGVRSWIANPWKIWPFSW